MLIVVLAASDADRVGLEVQPARRSGDCQHTGGRRRVGGAGEGLLRNWRRHDEMGHDRQGGSAMSKGMEWQAAAPWMIWRWAVPLGLIVWGATAALLPPWVAFSHWSSGWQLPSGGGEGLTFERGHRRGAL